MDLSKPWPNVSEALRSAPANVEVAVSVRDVAGDQRFGHRENQQFPSASTIKLIILAALAQAVDSSRLHLDDLVPVQEAQKVGGSGLLQAMTTPNLALSLADHALLMIGISDNTASNVLIDAVGSDSIRDTQERLGLRGTELGRKFLGRRPESGMPDNVTTASDLVTVLTAIATNSAASRERCEWMMSVLRSQQFTDRLGRKLPESMTFAGKSGWLDDVSHDCGLLSSSRGTAAVAVLTQGFPDKHQASAFIGSIGEAVVRDLNLA